MGISEPNLIQQRYEKNEHFYYPAMQQMIDDVMAKPEEEIAIPDDFIGKSLENTNFLMNIVRSIKILFQKIILNIKCFFSSSYTENYNRAVTKIKDAYEKKISIISKLSEILKKDRQPIEEGKKEVSSLNERIQVLKDELQADKENLQEKIDAKNLIVQQARALKEKREHVPTTYEKVAGIFSYLKSFVVKPQGEAEADEIKALDEAFPLNELTDQTIDDYENEEFDASPLITDLKARKIVVANKETQLERDQKKLEEVRNMLKTAVENIQQAANEVERLNLANFFNDDDLAIPDIAEEAVNVPKKELTPREIQLQTISQDFIRQTENKDLAILFNTLLKRLPEDAITSWQCDDKGNFTLKLNEAYHIWMPDTEVKGGAVIMLGYEKDGEIKGRLEKDNIFFTSGMNSFVKVALLGCIAPTFDGIQYHSRTDIRIGGTYLGQTQWKQKNYTGLKKDWEQNGIFIGKDHPDGYKKFLEDKVAAS